MLVQGVLGGELDAAYPTGGGFGNGRRVAVGGRVVVGGRVAVGSRDVVVDGGNVFILGFE